MPGVYECLEAERIKYAIRLPANQVLQNRIAYLLKRPVGRPPNEVRRYYANFTYQAELDQATPVVAKVEWHPGELIPRVGFIVTNMSRRQSGSSRSTTSVAHASNGLRKARERSIGRGCHVGRSPPTRYGSSFMRSPTISQILRTLATPEPIKDWSLTSLKEKLIKIGAKVVSHGRYVAFQMAEVAIPRQMYQERSAAHYRTATAATACTGMRRRCSCVPGQPTGGVRPNASENGQISPSAAVRGTNGGGDRPRRQSVLPKRGKSVKIHAG